MRMSKKFILDTIDDHHIGYLINLFSMIIFPKILHRVNSWKKKCQINLGLKFNLKRFEKMDLVNTGSDPWILEYDACEKLYREIMEHLNARNAEKTSSQTYDVLSAKIRIKLKQFSTELAELNKKLTLASFLSTLTLEERERRKRQVEILQSKEVQLKEHFNQRNRSEDFSELVNTKSRAQLFEHKRKEATSSKVATSQSEKETNSYENFETKTIADMKSENERLLREQNEGLESLLKIVTNQKQIANSINNEVDHHNEILVEISDNMERVDERMNQATSMVTIIGKKESIWGYWLVAFLLLIAILGVAFA